MAIIVSIIVCSCISYYTGYKAGIEKTRQVLYKQLWKIYAGMSDKCRLEFETLNRRILK